MHQIAIQGKFASSRINSSFAAEYRVIPSGTCIALRSRETFTWRASIVVQSTFR